MVVAVVVLPPPVLRLLPLPLVVTNLGGVCVAGPQSIWPGPGGSNRCGFLVAGRQSEGQFMSLSDVRVPERFQTLFTEIPESKFRMDISSTDIRTA